MSKLLCKMGIHKWKLHFKAKSYSELVKIRKQAFYAIMDGCSVSKYTNYCVKVRCSRCGKKVLHD